MAKNNSRLAVSPDQQVQVLVTSRLIDFYRSANQAVVSLLHNIVVQLGSEHFERFHVQRQLYDELMSAPEIDPPQEHNLVEQATQAFMQDYAELLRDNVRVVLFFDTCEEMRAVQSWMSTDFLPGIAEIQIKTIEEQLPKEAVNTASQTVVVLAGRTLLEDVLDPELRNRLHTMQLGSLKLENVREFFHKSPYGKDLLTDEQIERVFELSDGRPLHIALSYDWLVNNVGQVEELLAGDMPFTQVLVSWVFRLRYPETRAILYAALASRRMEASLLARLLHVPIEEAQNILAELSRFSFTKASTPTEDFEGSFQLHDGIRDLINTYIWPQEGLDTQQALLREIIEWYRDGIGDEALLRGDYLPRTAEERSLLVEWLYYTCQLDLNEGLAHLDRLFPQAAHSRSVDLCAMLNHEIERRQFWDRLTPAQRDLQVFRKGLVEFYREHYDEAAMHLSSLLRRRDMEPKLRATTLMQLVELKAYTGEPGKALEYAEDADRAYRALMSSPMSDEQRERIDTEYGQLHNNWGYVCRVLGQWEGAHEHYDIVFKYPGHKKNIARTLNNKGYVYFLQGQLVEARAYVGHALRIRQEVGNPYELGLGYNTMGFVTEVEGRVDEAANLYATALQCFEGAASQRGRGMVLLNRGRLGRLKNNFDPALIDLNEAYRIASAKRDKAQLIEVLNERGCLYRQFRQDDSWEKAKTDLERSLALSIEMTNKYNEADNWEDLSILYYEWSKQAQANGDEPAFLRLREQAANALEHASRLAREHGFTYLQGKAALTSGELCYQIGEYDQAFDWYFDACEGMLKASQEGGFRSPILLRQRFDQAVDHLQKRLDSLNALEDRRLQSQRLLARLEALSPEDRAQLGAIEAFIKASVFIIDRFGSLTE